MATNNKTLNKTRFSNDRIADEHQLYAILAKKTTPIFFFSFVLDMDDLPRGCRHIDAFFLF